MSGAAPLRWRRDPAAGRRIVKVAPGEHHVTDDPEAAIATVLGSCVSACIRDPVAGVGGLNHFMLPESADGVWGKAAASLRYGNFAMERLVNDILRRGGRRELLEIKLFGGARLGGDRIGIGERNADFVEAYLRAEGMVPVARDLRGRHARRLVYLPVCGRAFLLELVEQPAESAEAEARFGRRLGAGPPSGTVELFR